MTNKVLAFGALTLMLATPAFAQSTKMDKPKAEMQQRMQQHQSMPADKGAMDKGAMDKSPSAAAATNGAAANTAINANRRPGFVQSQTASEWRASKLIGADVVGPDDKSIGEINELVLGQQGEIKAAVIGVGGFLGIGEKNVAVPFEALDVQRKADSGKIEKITVTYSKDQLKNAPKFAYYEEHANKPATTGMNPGGTPSLGATHPPAKTAPKK